MATQAKWELSGDYFENCNCNVVCPCLVSPGAPLTARPTQGVCDVVLAFHIDKGKYADVSLDGLNVVVAAHTPGPMGEGNWTLAAYIDERASDQQTEALGAIFGGSAGGPMAIFAPLVSKNLGAKKVAINYAVKGKNRTVNIPGIANMAVEPLGSLHPRGRFGPRLGHPVAPDKTCVCRWQQGQHVRRPRHALGQFRQERTLRAYPLVELTLLTEIVRRGREAGPAAVPEEATSVFEAVLRRDRVVVVAALVLVIALSWLWIVTGAGTGMSAIEMTRMPRDMMMTPAIWTPAYAALMFLMWWVMMLAMMLPSAAPVLLIFARISRQGQRRQAAVDADRLLRCRLSRRLGRFQRGGHGLAMGAGRERAAFGHDGDDCDLARRGHTDRCRFVAVCAAQTGLPALLPFAHRLPYRAAGAAEVLAHSEWGWNTGRYCLGCCWFLMALLFFGGVMNLWWIGGLAAYILIEKVLPMGHWLSYAVGIGLVSWGALLLMTA